MRRATDIATCVWYTGIEPFSKKPVTIARNLRDRKPQRPLTPFFKPENDFLVRDALAQAGRADLIGGCEGLIPAHPPKEAIEARRREADHYHTVANPAKGECPASAVRGRRKRATGRGGIRRSGGRGSGRGSRARDRHALTAPTSRVRRPCFPPPRTNNLLIRF